MIKQLDRMLDWFSDDDDRVRPYRGEGGGFLSRVGRALKWITIGSAATIIAAPIIVDRILTDVPKPQDTEDAVRINRTLVTQGRGGHISQIEFPDFPLSYHFGKVTVSERPHPLERYSTLITVRNSRYGDIEHVETPGNIARCEEPKGGEALDYALVEYSAQHEVLDLTFYLTQSRKFCRATTTPDATNINVSCNCYTGRSLVDTFVERINTLNAPTVPLPPEEGAELGITTFEDPVKKLAREQRPD